MAIYKIFPSKDTTLYSQYPSMNTGRDEILEASLEVNGIPNPLPQTSRILIQFDNDEINNILDTYIISSSVSKSDGYFSIEFNDAGISGLPTSDGDQLYISTDNYNSFWTVTFSSSVDTFDGSQAIKYNTGTYTTWISNNVIPYLYSSSYITASFYSMSAQQGISGGILKFYTNGALNPIIPGALTSGWDSVSPITLTSSSGNDAYLITSSYSTSLKLYTSNIKNLSTDTIVELYPTSGSWDMGTGKYKDNPETQNGTSWIWRDYSGSKSWIPNSYNPNTTGSYSSSTDPGGGTWFISSSYSDYNNFTQSFGYYNSTDINIKVNKIIEDWYLNIIPNNGFILKQKDEFISNINYQPILKYFSRDTHTIYPPCLEFRWRDYTFNTGSSTQTILNTLPAIITLSENPGVFYQNSINRFRLNSRPEYPARVYQTASIYSIYSYLPTASYYAVQDLSTNEFVIDFDDQYTQISADSTSNYFDIYMSGLEPERYYKIVIKTTINGSTLIFDNNYYFKVVNG